jgi:hypothetical protein
MPRKPLYLPHLDDTEQGERPIDTIGSCMVRRSYGKGERQAATDQLTNVPRRTSNTMPHNIDNATRGQLLAHLKTIKEGAKKAIELRAPLSQLVWKVRKSCTIVIDGVTLPDWGGNSDDYKAFMKETFIAAGFVITGDMTRDQERLVREARKSFNDAIRYDLRKLADAELNRQQLLVSGFVYDPKLPDTQVLNPTDIKKAPEPKLLPPETLITTLCSQAINLSSQRAADVRSMPVMSRIEAYQSIQQALTALLAVVKPTPAERKAAEKDAAERAELLSALQAMSAAADASKADASKAAPTPAAKDSEPASK